MSNCISNRLSPMKNVWGKTRRGKKKKKTLSSTCKEHIVTTLTKAM